MKIMHCSNDGKTTGHKRTLGFEALFMILLTGGLRVIANPLSPPRFIVCGSAD
jgi:hypothetical protein